MENQNRVQWVYSSQDNQELAERYDQWAKDYDADLDQDFGWIAPQRVVDFFSKHVPKDARVLDAGAGTGLAGEILRNLGYQEIVAMDLSQGMLDEAREERRLPGVSPDGHGRDPGFPLRLLWSGDYRGGLHRGTCSCQFP